MDGRNPALLLRLIDDDNEPTRALEGGLLLFLYYSWKLLLFDQHMHGGEVEEEEGWSNRWNRSSSPHFIRGLWRVCFAADKIVAHCCWIFKLICGVLFIRAACANGYYQDGGRVQTDWEIYYQEDCNKETDLNSIVVLLEKIPLGYCAGGKQQEHCE